MTATRRRVAFIAALGTLVVSLARCASPGIPPGGPDDNSPPQLIGVSPESGSTNVRSRDIELEFDEVVNEAPSGNAASLSTGSGANASTGPSLAGVVLLSPRAGATRVDWHRERLTVHPRNALRPNTTYTLTLLPGLADLRQNVRDSAISIVFSTGPNIATGRVAGVIFDWVAGKPAPRAIVELIAPDSTTYVTLADSVGRWVVPNIPSGEYVVRGVVDANNNRAFDPREPFDTVRVTPARVALGDSAKVELLAFIHDTIGPRIGQVTIRDSVTLSVSFDRPLDPTQTRALNQFRLVMGRDSVDVPLSNVETSVQHDSAVARRRRAAADSAAKRDTAKRDSTKRDTTARPRPAVPLPPRDTARRDTTRRTLPPPVPSRQSPPSELVLTLRDPLRPQTSYVLFARNQRSVSGVETLQSQRQFSTPKPEPKPEPKPAPTDTTKRAPNDTTRRAPADTTRRRPR